MDIQRLNTCARWSDATIYQGIIHFVDVPAELSGDMVQQIDQVLQQAENRLLAVGSNKERLLSATIYVTDFADLPALNQAWEAWLPMGTAPSRACLKVELVDPQMRVEIALVAALA